MIIVVFDFVKGFFLIVKANQKDHIYFTSDFVRKPLRDEYI